MRRAALIAACLLVSAGLALAQSEFLPLLFSGEPKMTEEQAAQVEGRHLASPCRRRRRHLRPLPRRHPPTLPAHLQPAALRHPTCAGVWEQVGGFRLDGSVLDDGLRAAAEAAGAEGATDVDFQGPLSAPQCERGPAGSRTACPCRPQPSCCAAPG